MGINVLSLFDGISCGRVALERARIEVDNYFASEIDKHAIKVSMDNWKDIVHIGDVTKICYKEGVLYNEEGSVFEGKIDLVIGGSPYQGFSMSGKQLAFDDPRSVLYFEYERIVKEILAENPEARFLLENVKMKKEHSAVISERLGVEPIAINSSLMSAQNRYRLYWTNIEGIVQPADKHIFLKDILEQGVEEYLDGSGRLKWLEEYGKVKSDKGYVAFNPLKGKCLTVRGEPSWNTTYVDNEFVGAAIRGRYFNSSNIVGRRLVEGKRDDYNKSVDIVQCLEVGDTHKSRCLTTVSKDTLVSQLPKGRYPNAYTDLQEGIHWRKLTPIECERLQTLPDNYTKAISNSQRYKALGNGWTVDVIVHIFSFMKENNERERQEGDVQ